MRYLTTRHWRLISFVALLLLAGAWLNALVLKSPVLPAHKDQILLTAFVIAMATVFLIKPTPDVGRLRVPSLSQLQLRIVLGVLSVACLLALANYHWLDPGFFAPYKRQVSGVMFGIAVLFVHLYEPQIAELGRKGPVGSGGDA